MADTTFTLESAAGVIQLASTDEEVSPFRLAAGTTGLGLPAERFRSTASPAGGGTYRGHAVAERNATLVIDISGTSRADTDALMRRLAWMLDSDNAPQLVADIPGEDIYRLNIYRIAGGEEGYDDGGDLTVRWTVDVQSPSPYWVADTPVSLGAIEQSASSILGLLPDLAMLPVMGSVALGAVNVVNPGDVAAPISWRITGPGGPAVVNIAGRGFTLATTLAAGKWVDIQYNGRSWRVTDQAGAPAYHLLGPAPKFPMAPVGAVTGSATLAGAQLGASIAGWFNPLRKLVH